MPKRSSKKAAVSRGAKVASKLPPAPKRDSEGRLRVWIKRNRGFAPEVAYHANVGGVATTNGPSPHAVVAKLMALQPEDDQRWAPADAITRRLLAEQAQGGGRPRRATARSDKVVTVSLTHAEFDALERWRRRKGLTK